jgi:hypothetical protein
MSKMTEGPWEARFDVDETDEEQKWIVKSAANKLVNDGYIIALFGGPDAEANCRGAANLPDLIEAAEPIVQELNELEKALAKYSAPTQKLWNVDDSELIITLKAARTLRSALLKVKGGEG